MIKALQESANVNGAVHIDIPWTLLIKPREVRCLAGIYLDSRPINPCGAGEVTASAREQSFVERAGSSPDSAVRSQGSPKPVPNCVFRKPIKFRRDTMPVLMYLNEI
jgi:hypothetical protein